MNAQLLKCAFSGKLWNQTCITDPILCVLMKPAHHVLALQCLRTRSSSPEDNEHFRPYTMCLKRKL